MDTARTDVSKHSAASFAAQKVTSNGCGAGTWESLRPAEGGHSAFLDAETALRAIPEGIRRAERSVDDDGS